MKKKKLFKAILVAFGILISFWAKAQENSLICIEGFKISLQLEIKGIPINIESDYVFKNIDAKNKDEILVSEKESIIINETNPNGARKNTIVTPYKAGRASEGTLNKVKNVKSKRRL